MVQEKIGVIGAGSWGTSLAILLSEKGHDVSLWVYEKDLSERIKKNRVNDLYLQGFKIPESVFITTSLKESSDRKDLIVTAVPSHVLRAVLTDLAPFIDKKAILISCTKGIENDTLLTPSGIMKEILPEEVHNNLSFLSGPSFALEVAKKLPTAVSVASYDRDAGLRVQTAFNTNYFRVYTNPDVIGVELGGAIKNVIAIASGVSDGLRYGNNARAALITRGLREISRLGIVMGANPLTFSGLSGLGDLILTCTGELSRNRTVGYKLGQGIRLKDILLEMRMVAEGVNTTKAAYRLSKKYNVEMPITEQVYKLLYKDKEPKDVVKDLMARGLKDE
jgi:glycerol-3-phosphate dehydrogenase (NAD(P)+)